MRSEHAVVAALVERGAAQIDHPGGRLIDHLIRTSELLRSWGAPRENVVAGLAHAAYGTERFESSLYTFDERQALIGLIGESAEAIVYRYATFDRGFTYPNLHSHGGLIRDRLTGCVTRLDEAELRPLVEITIANELDVARHSWQFRHQHGDSLRALFEGWHSIASAAALEECRRVFGCPADHQPQDRSIIAGIRLHYLEWGRASAQTVVFLHGGGLNAHTWDAICIGLPDHHCIAVDLRGHGDSEWSPTLDYGLDAHAQDLDCLLTILCIQRPILVCHSLGAYAALTYACRRSADITALVIVDASPLTHSEETVKRIRSFMRDRTSFATFDDALDHALDFSPARHPDRMRSSLRHALRLLDDGTWTWKRDQRHLDESYTDAIAKDARSLAPLFQNIRCPTLIVRGEHSLSAEDAEEFRSLLHDGRCACVPDAGHNVHSDNPTGLLNVLAPYLAEQQLRDTSARARILRGSRP